MRDVFDPVETFNNLIRDWWKIALAAIIGGLIGLSFSFFQPPVYQAEAIFYASLDFTEINFDNLVGEFGGPVMFTQFDEDLALQVVERVLLAERHNALAFAQTLDPDLDGLTFRNDMQIRRYLGRWYLRYRHEDPVVAQAIVNYWADIGLESLKAAQATGQAESFVIIDQIADAEQPQAPIYYHRNTFVLAGTVCGFLLGIFAFEFRERFINQRIREA
jgi:uncharacterized protein involved in exopolysaccharide biosynthesis